MRGWLALLIYNSLYNFYFCRNFIFIAGAKLINTYLYVNSSITIVELDTLLYTYIEMKDLVQFTVKYS